MSLSGKALKNIDQAILRYFFASETDVENFASCACRGKDNQAVGAEAIIAPLDKLQPTPPPNFSRHSRSEIKNII